LRRFSERKENGYTTNRQPREENGLDEWSIAKRGDRQPMSAEKERKPTGPQPKRLKLEGDWEDAVKKALAVKPPKKKPKPKKKP